MSGETGFAPGAVVGPWELVSLLGRGGFSEVWLARGPEGTHGLGLHRKRLEVALKLIVHPEHAANLRAEAQALSLVRGEGIVRTIASDLAGEPPWIALELCRGDLRSRLAKAGGRLAPSEALRDFEQILAILARVHREGVVHGDLKPENVLLGLHQRADGDSRLRLADFGLSRRITQTTATLSVSLSRHDARLAGTLDYMAPEQREGNRPTPRSDVYAAGVILHELLFGERPQGVAAPASARDPRLPGYLDQVLERCLALDPGARFASGSDALRFLRSVHWAECDALKRGVRGLRDRLELVRAWPLVWAIGGVVAVACIASNDDTSSLGWRRHTSPEHAGAAWGALAAVLIPFLAAMPALLREKRALRVEIVTVEEKLKTLLAWRELPPEPEWSAEVAAQRIRQAKGPTGLWRWMRGFRIRWRRARAARRRRLAALLGNR